ncbi:hypothetical protein J2S41_006672 [Catenuloplanes atrovinosus]|uniref:DDE superfamily endonuclease n=1 Tax=Catenuloplanes atrovinosus TaxID=137266 RepID=A0AAE3YX86_9ACTN|nr:hypothetical protein [Catenuloplanes atrovinosus]
MARNKVELCLTPTSASWANPIEAQFGPLRTFVMAGSNHPNHTAQSRQLHKYLRWRNANARHPDVLLRAPTPERHSTWDPVRVYGLPAYTQSEVSADYPQLKSAMS